MLHWMVSLDEVFRFAFTVVATALGLKYHRERNRFKQLYIQARKEAESWRGGR